jgi:alpha-beta hydrolase superfamily lysophospholipase
LADMIPWKFSASDGYRWYYRHFPANGKAVARVVGIHGIQSHGGWYEGSSRHLRDAGCDVFFVDRRGSGQNQECRGDTPSFRRLLDDIGEFLRTLKGPGQPRLFVSAISWGGKIAAGLCYRFPGLIDGLALMAPGFKPRVSPSIGERLKIAAARIRRPTRMFPIPLNDPTLFTANVDRQEFIRKDPLALREATARFLVESTKFDVYLRRAPRHVTPPVLLMLGGEDRIIDNERTRQYVSRFATRDLKVCEYPGAHHTLEFEPAPAPIFADLTTWILDRSRS